jgi:hypothetical protein
MLLFENCVFKGALGGKRQTKGSDRKAKSGRLFVHGGSGLLPGPFNHEVIIRRPARGIDAIDAIDESAAVKSL